MDMNIDLDLQLNSDSFLNLEKRPTVSLEVLYDHLIIGGGPAGLNAALYAKRKGLTVGILTKNIGGQVINTSVVENYLGSISVNGENLINQFLTHLDSLNIPISEGVEVSDINNVNDIYEVSTTSNKKYRAKTLLIATGSKPRKLNVPGEKEYQGKGIAYCAICDAPLFRDRNVIIAGGGNSAVEAAIDLAKLAKSVTLVHRSQFRADKILVDSLYTNDKIKVHLETEILEILGDKVMTSIKVLDKLSNKERIIETDGIFIEIGNQPNSKTFANLLELNERKEIIVDELNQTNIPGIFAAGDVIQGHYKQIIIATSDGAKAALAANDYINQQAKKA